MDRSGVGKRKRFSFAEKYEILKELDAGVKRPFLEQKHGISHGTLVGFLKIEQRSKRPLLRAQI